MLTISKPMKQCSVRYYNDTARAAISASADRQRAGGGLAEYYSEGETRAPVWVCVGGSGDVEKAVGLSAADRAGGPADMDVVARWLDEGIAPNGASGRAFSARSTHGFDLTFCAPKSVSLLRALGGNDVMSKAVVDAHDSAVREALEYLYDHAGYTRVHNPETGKKDLVRLPGLVMAGYQHETNRDGEPHLHTHVLLPNRQARSDGELVSIDSKSLHHEAKAAGVIYQVTLRQQLLASMGVEWGPIDPHTGMAEVAGVDRATIRAWSQRSTELREWAQQNLVIDDEAGASAAQLAAAQKATRPAKPEHLSWAELKHLWATDPRGFVVAETAQLAARRARTSTRFDLHALARQAATGIDKAACTRADLVEAIGALFPPSLEGTTIDGINTVAPRYLIEATVKRIGIRINAPRLAHEREGHERFTTAAVLAEEAALLDLMGARDERAALAPAALDTAGLSADQAAAITAIATSPWLIQPLSAPAGAGKTTSLKALRAAAHRGGTPRVVVLAPTGKAVDVAVREGAGDAGYTVAKAIKDLRTHELTFDARTLIVVDEAGMVGTPQLRELLTATTAAGTKTVLVGDAFQLAPVQARGGMFAQLVDDLPWAQKLSEVWRMRDPDERTASLAVRNGGPKPLRRAVEWYRTHDRLHSGDALTMAHDALRAYQADLDAGKDALLMTDRWDLCDALNTRLHHHNVAPETPTVIAARGHRIGAGDVIISRRNDPTVPVVNATVTDLADPVRNGHRWHVDTVDPKNNRIAAHRLTDGARAVFTGDYLTEHIHYGYAVTVHAAQGATAGDALTAGTAHAILSEAATRNLAYVALTRGRDANHVYTYDNPTSDYLADHVQAADHPGVHAAQRGTSRDAATALRTILGRDDRHQTLMAAAAAADRTHQPPEVRALLTQRDKVRAHLRTEHHIDTAARDLAAALPALRTEMDVADIAGRGFSPATGYSIPAGTLDHLDETHRRVVTALARDLQAVQSLHLYPGADKAAALAAVTDAAHRDHRLVLALPATPDAHAYGTSQRYADNTGSVGKIPTDKAITRIRELAADGRRLPPGGLVLVDDADHLPADQLHWLADNAAATNTKLLLITIPDQRTPAHTLTAALDHLLPWAQHLGTPDLNHQRPRSAIERADHHLATTPSGAELPSHQAARELLHRRDQLLDHFRDMRRLEEQLADIDDRNRARARDKDRGYDFGLGL